MNKKYQHLIFISLALLLQTLYYLVFMHQDFKHNVFSYNPISIISLVVLLIYYLVKTYREIRFKTFDYAANLRWFLIVFIVINSFLVIGSLLGNLMFNILYFFFTSQAISTYTSALPTTLWHFNLGQFNIMIIVLFSFNYLKSKPTNKEELFAKNIYKIISLLILVFIIIGVFTYLDILFYHSFTIMAFLIFWFFIPIFYIIIKHFHVDIAVISAWGFSLLIYWPLIRELFDHLVHIYGYMLP